MFIHIPKNAGTSVNHYLYITKSIMHSHHKSAIKSRDADEKIFKDYFKFAIVRNPWDRLVSQYFFNIKLITINKYTKHGLNNNDLKFQTFRDLVLSYKDITRVPYQYSWICDEQDNILVDYIGRYENLEETFRYIGNKIGVDPARPIPHANASKHKHYTEYYDEETKEIIAKVFKKDIELFRYEFDKHPGPNIIINSREDFVPVSSRK